MRPVPTRLLSAVFGGLFGLLAAGLAIVVEVDLLFRLGDQSTGTASGLFLTTLVAAVFFAGLEAFRWAFNGLCEHRSEEATPPWIRPFRRRHPWWHM